MPRKTTIPAPRRVSMLEAAKYAGVSRMTIRRRIADGTLPAIRVPSGPRKPPKLVRVDLNDVDIWLDRKIPTAGDGAA